jgi:Undecaprenyl-phosphate glucose phosphotransferase
MLQRRRVVASFLSDEDVAPYAPPRLTGAMRGRNARAVAEAIPLDEFRVPPKRAVAPPAGRSSALGRMAFSWGAAACDGLVIFAASSIAGLISQAWLAADSAHSMSAIGIMAAALFVLPNAMRREYRFDNYLKSEGHVGRSVVLWSLAFACILLMRLATKVTVEDAPGAIVIFFLFGFLALAGMRIGAVRLAQKHLRPGSALSRRVFIVGDEDEIANFRARHEAQMRGMEIVGVHSWRGHGRMSPDLASAVSAARAIRPDEVFIILSWSHKKAIDACVNAFAHLPAAIHFGPNPVVSRYANARRCDVGCVPCLDLVHRPLSDGEIILKRLLDLVGASVGLAALAPALPLVAILIKLDSPGPVFFSQRRYGFNQEPFRIFKFRTMTTLEDGPRVIQACQNDRRVTRVGRWLRRFNIDELPQLVNVLRGEMSLVGPRPHASAHDEQFQKSIACYARRHNMKPGITGWAQVNGFRGEIKSQDDIRRRVEHDLFYLDNWSIWLDFECIWRTIVSARAYCNAY